MVARTRQPRCASVTAVSRPKPLEAPVTRAVRSSGIDLGSSCDGPVAMSHPFVSNAFQASRANESPLEYEDRRHFVLGNQGKRTFLPPRLQFMQYSLS